MTAPPPAAGDAGERPRLGAVVLTMGNRPDDLDRALTSLLGQTGVELDVVVVGNGWQPTGLPPGVRGHRLPENLGIPAGRNAGVPLVEGELLFFLDDDARLPQPGVPRARARYQRNDMHERPASSFMTSSSASLRTS